MFTFNFTFLIIVLIGLIVRWCISLNSYSGAGKPPLYGDYEAQRHWMEITYNLPIKQWYVNSTENNLQYWGLDYPPLTAYHSWICAVVASRINNSWVELTKSRGHESVQHKLFMRFTVLLADLLIFFPAVFVYFASSRNPINPKEKIYFPMAVMLLYPGLILIDHGHFQYNCVSLGLFLWGIVGVCRQRHLLASIAFVLALNYKQMELYHAPAFFFYLLGACFTSNENSVFKLSKISSIVLITLACCWLPFLHNPLPVLHRLFPFARGVFEDKVSNVWCSLTLFIKFKQLFSNATMVKICLASTLLALIPHSIHLLLKSTVQNFKVALVNSSLIFFLFSFQVHEKSILLVSLPVCLLLLDRPFPCIWFLFISTFSMTPLLIKDGLITPLVGTSLLFFISAETGLLPGFVGRQNEAGHSTAETPSMAWRILFWLSMSGAVVLILCSLLLTPPTRLPDIFPVMISVYSCGHFLLFMLYFHWLQFTIGRDSHKSERIQQVRYYKSETRMHRTFNKKNK